MTLLLTDTFFEGRIIVSSPSAGTLDFSQQQAGGRSALAIWVPSITDAGIAKAVIPHKQLAVCQATQTLTVQPIDH